MAHSSTVEDYLKHLYLQQQAHRDQLVPTGKVARALGVTPGTATVMIKTLAESGLVEHEPRAGAKLTDKGQRLALHVLRRHRIIELFLVKTLEFDWSEVADEAEILEHAVSEKVLDRIDKLLGHPTVDPHGDPIPTATGEIARPRLQPLTECDGEQSVRIARVDDTDADFLRFADERGLTPGTTLTVEAVDSMADAVTIRPEGGQPMVVGSAAARRIFVRPN